MLVEMENKRIVKDLLPYQLYDRFSSKLNRLKNNGEEELSSVPKQKPASPSAKDPLPPKVIIGIDKVIFEVV